MLSNQIRRSFLDFFASKQHTEVSSSSLVPGDDPTLLFTNAGMVQFKRVFQGLEKRDYDRATTSQKCVRAGGKHNDLEEVGHTTRHHTFFEMLGNFSFGDYFKKEAIEYAWEWVASEQFLGIDPDLLYFTVHHTDEEAAGLWHEVTGVSKNRIFRLGDKDNFWQMGDTGPCGPCSEIFVDLRSHPGNGKRETLGAPSSPEEFEALADSGQFMEIWNLVFMQFDQTPDAPRSPLPAPSVDTGAGLERIAAVLQGADSNFHTDLFMPIISRVEEVLGMEYDRGEAGVGFRVLADHARAIAFLLADGVYPSNDGRGYVLRRILRRGVRHAYILGRTDPTLVHLCDTVVSEMGGHFPELKEKAKHIADVTLAEEERFLETIDGGMKRMDDLTSSGGTAISGDDAFKLYDTFGFPIDLTEIVAAEKGFKVDVEGFEAALNSQQERSRAARKGAAPGVPAIHTEKGGKFTEVKSGDQEFVGYDHLKADTEILAFRASEDRLDLILQDNPFYAESGGQVSDMGWVRGGGWEVVIGDVSKNDNTTVVSGRFDGPFEATSVTAIVDESRRRDIERNHSATHLAHAALRYVLGDHVRQAGSVVDPNRLRFDFSHQSPINPEDLNEIEAMVNEGVLRNADLDVYEMPYDEALKKGAMALFGEKYGDLVRVVDMGDLSVELCGGTHVRTTGQIGSFHFTGESGVAAGVRRVEAVTGRGAYSRLKGLEARLGGAAEKLRTTPEHVPSKVEALLEERQSLEKRVEELLKSGGGGFVDGTEKHNLGPVTLELANSGLEDRNQIGLMIDAYREQNAESVLVVFSGGDRPGIHVGVTDDIVTRGAKAGNIAKRIAELTGGKGGGRPHFASAGVGDPTKLPFARSRVMGIVAEELGLRVDD